MQFFAVSPLTLCLPLLTLALGACNPSIEEPEVATMSGALTRMRSTRVRVQPAIRREMVRTLETTCVVESEHHIVIHPRATGELVELLAEEGDRVENGALLAVLDQRDAKAQLAEAQIALREAQDAAAKGEIVRREAEGAITKARLSFKQAGRDFTRNETAQLISAQDLEQLELTRDTAQAELTTMILARDRAEIEGRAAATSVERAELTALRAEVSLSHTELRAPFAGVIAQRQCQLGSQLSPSDAAFTLTDLSDLRTVFYRPQRELALFSGLGTARAGDGSPQAGLENILVTAESEALPGHSFGGRIERISPGIDATSGSFRVTVRLEPESDGLRLLPGMLLRLRLVVERHPDSLVVSKRALKREGETTILFVARDDKAVRIEVLERFSDDDEVEVQVMGEGTLSEGDLVIVVGNRDLEDQLSIQIVDAAPSRDAR
jgi:RND family efflux transporter MFP subunit